ncbi:hypothetical protein KR074_000948 [Drosophila pseudoananassae]|nr:hypothetical protein KR074_000948 [Drosophila pseudoananassae]
MDYFPELDEDLDYSQSSVDSESSDMTIRAGMENTFDTIHLARRLASGMTNDGGPVEPFRSPELRRRYKESMKLNRLMNSRLGRDNLPEDTPLPMYLSFREPRGVSPPSTWDSPDPLKRCRH